MKPASNVMENRHRHDNGTAFTLLELVVVLGVIAFSTMLIVPALARTQLDSRAFRCLNNHAQLCRAWLMYADSNNGKLATSGQGTYVPGLSQPWVLGAGWLDWGLSTDNTNVAYLIEPRYSALAPYCGKNAGLFKCPADQYLSVVQRARGWRERVRSVSENIYLASGETVAGPMILDYYAQVTKLAGLTNPKPAETWVSIDEHPDSINEDVFFAPRLDLWIDLPANYHDGGAGVVFADGHSEMHRWQSSALKFPVAFSFPSNTTAPTSDPDLYWFRAHTPRRPGLPAVP